MIGTYIDILYRTAHGEWIGERSGRNCPGHGTGGISDKSETLMFGPSICFFLLFLAFSSLAGHIHMYIYIYTHIYISSMGRE